MQCITYLINISVGVQRVAKAQHKAQRERRPDGKCVRKCMKEIFHTAFQVTRAARPPPSAAG